MMQVQSIILILQMTKWDLGLTNLLKVTQLISD